MSADTVLLVEDEPLVRTLAMIVIEEEIGCRCEIAANRDEAFKTTPLGSPSSSLM